MAKLGYRARVALAMSWVLVNKAAKGPLHLYALPIVGTGGAAGVCSHSSRVARRLAPDTPVQKEHDHPNHGEHWCQNCCSIPLWYHLEYMSGF